MKVKAVSFSGAAAKSWGRTNPAVQSASDSLWDAVCTSEGAAQPTLDALRQYPATPPTPGRGGTGALWEFFASVAAQDLVAARALEPHFDAAAILEQAGLPWHPGTTWGVFAAEGPGLRLEASEHRGRWQLNGDKPWCSLAGDLTHALLSAHVPGGRRLFTVRLDDPGVQPAATAWVSRGLASIPSVPVHFEQVSAEPVGEVDWYLKRTGFAVGGVGVAACWFGGAVGLFRHLFHSAQRRAPDQLALSWLGEADTLLASGAATLFRAAEQADALQLGPRQASEVRGQIAGICERMLQISAHATGPGPLSLDENHARRVADLSIYLRQHHAARDEAALGSILLEETQETGVNPW
ncbi:acyl-CoA dehydrogenase [Glutamicibacter sp.]|uniref:acyl-CoA dehydrogenase n=1 Tax=Glutamicibacter sp. TaxID=1931995 RepID=UPI0028BE2B87|nr:acyl-CoA dehydrogenase [Glutamicibacter sp.]